MIYENKILKKANSASADLSFNDYCKMSGIEMIQSDVPCIEKDVEQNAKEILKHFSQCSDILLFIQSALSHSSSELRYNLHPPYTTSSLDCDFILKKLARVKLLDDFYFSSLSESYIIFLNPSSEYNLNNILSFALCSLLKDASADDISINSCVKYKNDEFFFADVVCRSLNKKLLFNFEIASGLEKDVSSHSDQLKRLSDKILKSYIIENHSINTFFIVTPHCRSLLPPHNRIISIDDIFDFIRNIG